MFLHNHQPPPHRAIINHHQPPSTTINHLPTGQPGCHDHLGIEQLLIMLFMVKEILVFTAKLPCVSSSLCIITVPGDDPAVPGNDPAVPGDDPAVPGDDPAVPGDDPLWRLAVSSPIVSNSWLMLTNDGVGSRKLSSGRATNQFLICSF
jgi:hypothetical protein